MGYSSVFFFGVLASAALIGIVTSYPNSVPNNPDVCSKMTPGHGPRPQLTAAPYEIILNKKQMQGGHNLQIELQGKKGQKFKGFYVQVRDEHGSPIGSFLIPNENEIGAHNCFDQKRNAVHHKNPKEKESITVYWKAPDSFDGKVRVVATVVQNYETYWVNVKAPELVSVSNTTDYFTSSSDFLEKSTTESAKNSKATRILNYNPYSPFSPLLSSWDNNDQNLSLSSEFLLPSASEDNSVRERQLFGIPSFDFHDSPYSPKLSPPRKSKSVYAPRPEHAQSLYDEPIDHHHQRPLFRPGKNIFPHHHHNSIVDTPKGSLHYNKRGELKEKHSGFNSISSHPYNYPQTESIYPVHHYPTHVHDTNNGVPLFPSNSYGEKPAYPPPHFSQSVQNDNGGHYFINHHHLQTPHFKPSYPKPASDPSYPNSGYFPKDILTRITSYIPNIYNALTNNPLFNFNIDNTIESIWKPMKGVPTKHDLPVSSSSTTMPKYGYLVYNPVRNNPYFVIPAENEEQFVANHFGRRKDTFASLV